jgi:Skp family chaperone for outer membrane proteins
MTTTNDTQLTISVPTGKTTVVLGKVLGTFSGIEGVTQGSIFLDAQKSEQADIDAAKKKIDDELKEELDAIDEEVAEHKKTEAEGAKAKTEAQEKADKEKEEIDETGKESNLVLQAETNVVLQAVEGSVAVFGNEDVIAGSRKGGTFVAGKKNVYVGAGIAANFTTVEVKSEEDPTPTGTPAVEAVKKELEDAEKSAAEVILIFECVNTALELAALIAGLAKDPIFILEVVSTAANLVLTWKDRIFGNGSGALTLHSKGATEIFAEKNFVAVAQQVVALLAPYAELTGMVGAEVKGGLTAGLSAGVAAKVFGGYSAEVVGYKKVGLIARKGRAEVVGKEVEIGTAHAGIWQSATENVEINASKEIELKATATGATATLKHDGNATVSGTVITLNGSTSIKLTTPNFDIRCGTTSASITALEPMSIQAVHQAEEAAQGICDVAQEVAKEAYNTACFVAQSTYLDAGKTEAANILKETAYTAAREIRDAALLLAATTRDAAVTAAKLVLPNIEVSNSGVTLKFGLCKIEVGAAGITLDAGIGKVDIKGTTATVNAQAIMLG